MVKTERVEEEGGGAAMSPSLPRLPSAATASSSARVLGRPVEGPLGFHSLRAPSPIVRAMRTRIDPPPPLPVAPPPPLPPPPPPPPPLLSQAPAKRRRGRPRNCDRLNPQPGFLLSPPARVAQALAAYVHCQSGGLQTHVLKIDVGEDIVSSILQLSNISGKAICVFSVLGSVQEAKLLHSSRAVLHKGPLEIIRMFGSILTPVGPGSRCLPVTLACADCSVVGGITAGPLIAATTVQAIVGTLFNNAFETKRTPKIIARYPNSQLPVGNGIRHCPNFQVTTGTESTHHSGFQVDMASGSNTDSQVAIGNGNTDYLNSHVPSCKGSTLFSNSQAVMGNGSTYYSNSCVPIGNGSTQYLNPQAVIGNGSTDYLNPQVPIGNGKTDHPNQHVPIGDGSTHQSNSPQITIGDGRRHHPSSLVTLGTGNTDYPMSKVAIGNGSTHQADSHVTIGDGSTSNNECLVTVDNEGTCNPKSQVTIADGRTNNINPATTVGDGSAYNLDSRPANNPDSRAATGNLSTPSVEVTAEQVSVDHKNTTYPNSKVSVGDESSQYPSNKAIVCEGSIPSIGGSTSCIVVEQNGSTETNVKTSDAVS